MSFNPFAEKPIRLQSCIEDWKKIYTKPYDKNDADPYTKVRLILMNGTEFEQQWFTHQLSRHTDNNDLRRDAALLRRLEQQQQKRLSYYKPIDETLLETTIGYEQVAVELTANLARRESDPYVKGVLDFALLEDFDHLYRYSALLESEQGIRAERLVGNYTEIMPGRPTIAEHRHPFDEVRRPINNQNASMLTKLNTAIITAAEQQTMNYYMNVGQFYTGSDAGRQLFLEIAMIEEQHVTGYESLMDPNATWLEGLLMHEYTECYLYYSAFIEETCPKTKAIWEQHLIQEIAHLHFAAAMLKRYENKHPQQVIADGTFPELLKFNGNADTNKQYVREVIKNTVNNTSIREELTDITNLPEDYDFFKYNNTVNKNTAGVPSHKIINSYIAEAGKDYRFEIDEHPVKELRNRKADNTDIARKK